MKNLEKNNRQIKINNFLMNKTKILSIACFAAFASFTACSKDSPLNPNGNCGNGNWAVQVQKEITNWSNASAAYSNDPTLANCNKYKSAGKKYLDALDGIKNCVPGTNANEFKEAIQEAKDELDESSCD